MFASRVDQENAIHAQVKPLKTPGKTPFSKVPLNDENATQQFGKTGGLKTGGKGHGIGLTVSKNGGKLDKSAFVTPAGPRNRAPLGFKTTNAKAAAFQTPAPLTGGEKSQQKTVSPRLRRAKVKVHQGEIAKDEEEEREIEYMPPRPKPLPDYPSDDEFGPDKTFPQLAPENLMRGWPSVYFNPVDDNGVSLVDKVLAKQDAEAAAYEDQLLQKAMDDDDKELTRATLEDLDFDLGPATSFQRPAENPPSPDPPKPKGKPLRTMAPPTVMSKSAAAALSKRSKAASGPSCTVPNAAVKARVPLAGVLGRKFKPASTTELSSTARFATASAASHSTLGYAKGRAASSHLKKPLSSIFKDGTESQKRSTSAAVPTPTSPKIDPIQELEEMIRSRNLDDNDADDDLFGTGGGVSLAEDDEFADFQLKMPE